MDLLLRSKRVESRPTVAHQTWARGSFALSETYRKPTCCRASKHKRVGLSLCRKPIESRPIVALFLAWINAAFCCSASPMTPAGLEPAIPGSVGRCLIHWATGPMTHQYPDTLCGKPNTPIGKQSARNSLCVGISHINAETWQCNLPP